MKATFSRWLPAITQTKAPRAALAIAGVAILGGLATTPVLGPAKINPAPSGVDPGAAAALRLAVSGAQPGDGAQSGSGEPSAAASSGASGDQASGSSTEPRVSAVPEAKPSMETLIPHGTQGVQARTQLSPEQLDNATSIVGTAKRMGLPERAAVIGVATALQESKLNNYGHLGVLNDHDSQGLFQQRPSTGWGTVEQVTDPEYSATAFYHGLQRVPGWQDLPLTAAAQRVQVSAYPFAYAQWEQQAAEIVRDLWTGRS
ncbi:hypothetical protein GCM10027280_48250 [Micromonospora polyrhachis]|uniref:Uncharacterized protein n=1 Tax=Micromonospora polyrhachis TaxID=1282883 RepID=A0A7W7WSL6_9ACTN|nr:hypothetical protein [Micromonospora polyrhachis]MBB4962255.1 hypothetical protein [Micromonospora polyrhachis]